MQRQTSRFMHSWCWMWRDEHRRTGIRNVHNTALAKESSGTKTKSMPDTTTAAALNQVFMVISPSCHPPDTGVNQSAQHAHQNEPAAHLGCTDQRHGTADTAVTYMTAHKCNPVDSLTVPQPAYALSAQDYTTNRKLALRKICNCDVRKAVPSEKWVDHSETAYCWSRTFNRRSKRNVRNSEGVEAHHHKRSYNKK